MSVTPDQAVSPREAIQARTRGAIAVAELSHAQDVHVGAGAKRLAAQATTEYHDRFLIELIQNAHDAHEKTERTGEVHILFAQEEGPFGALYVANRGNPFSRSNFKMLCELGLTDKPPGEAIGNKGLGFQSVLQVCARPEIYSADPTSGSGARSSFDGFCFSFATDRELLELLDGDEGRFEIVRGETATFHLPVPLVRQSERVRSFAQLGFATVIRLPLHRPGATEDVNRQLRVLREGVAPLLLFLDRLHHLSIEETPASDATPRLDLYRTAHDLAWSAAPDVDLAVVDLREHGRYFTASVSIPASDVAAVIADAVAANELEETWLEWKEDAVVSAAVRLDRSMDSGRLYTYLPMEVPAPLAGHLNAPFYARLDRRDLNPSLSLNALLLDAGARACLHAAEAIASRNAREFVCAAIDLFAWEPKESERLQNAVEGSPATKTRVLPAVGPDGPTWGSLSSTFLWPHMELKTLGPEIVAEAAEVDLLDQTLGPRRISQVARLHDVLLNRGMEPTGKETAVWVERVAENRARKKRALQWWNTFYDEIAQVLEEDGADLAGRRILLDEDWELRAACSSEAEDPTVFFQPVRQRTEGVVDIDAADDVHIPKTLRRRIVFLNPGLNWFERVGTTRKQSRARRFLERYDLVRPYAARSILEHLRDLLKGSRSKAVWRDALRLAYRLQRTRDYDQRPALRDLRLRVPCRGGWLEASSARFSSTWPGTMGGTLERLIELSAGTSVELTTLERMLMLPPESWGFAVDPEEWTSFLRKAGVRDGLWPVGVKPGRASARGSDYKPGAIARTLGLRGRQLELWVEAASARRVGPTVFNGSYRNVTPAYVLPGQADFPNLAQRARHEYAALVAAGCGLWADHLLAMKVQRTDVTSRNFDPFSWPTPVAAFLEKESWMPVTRPHARDQVDFVPLADAWHFSERTAGADDYALPDYAPLVPLRLRRLVDARPASLARLRNHGLKVWNESADSPDLVKLLGRLVVEEPIAEQYPAHVRRAYEQAWSHALLREEDAAEAAHAAFFVVTRSGQLDGFDPSIDPDEPLYVHDGGSRLTDSLLQLSTRPLLDIGEKGGKQVWRFLRGRLGPRVIRTSEERVVVLDGATAVAPHASSQVLIADQLDWLDGFVLAVVELRRGAFRRLTGPVRERIVETLRSIRVHFASEIKLQIGSEVLAPPHGMRDAVPLPDPDNPTLVIRGGGQTLTWSRLEAVCPALADLIGYAELAPAMQLAITRLMAHRQDAAVSSPSIDEIAEAISQPVGRVREVIRSLKGSSSALMDALAPALVALVGLEEYQKTAGEARSLDDEDEVVALLDELDLPVSAAELRMLARGAAGADDLRRALEIPLAEFNAALRSLGRAAIHYDLEHAQTFAAFVANERNWLLLELRRAYLPAFRQGLSLTTYVEARNSLRLLEPDPSWLNDHELPPKALMRRRVRQWLDEATPDLQPSDEDLEPLDVVQRANRAYLREVLTTAQRAVLAWCPRHTAVVPDLWNRADVEMTVWDALLEEGETDFEPIHRTRVLAWLDRHGDWPAAMPLSLELSDLGLTQDDLRLAQTTEQRERAHREFLKRSIELGGTRYSAAPENFAALAEAARASITETLLRTKTGFSGLTPPSPAGARGGGSGGKKAAGRRPTESQKEAIGLVGEVVALEWLKRRYPGASDESWRSGYRDFVVGGLQGDDSLGFDFEVPVGRTTYMFEVKATVGDDMRIELAESEVLAARQHARTDRYRILWLPFALDAVRRAIHVLPNPFADRGRDLFRLEGSGLKYRFRIEVH
jgi:hypothetical protein